MNEALANFVRRVMRDVLFLGVYSATVELDHLDGTFDVVPDDERLRGFGLQRVPALVGDVGARIQSRQGTRCLVGFENGDPRRPRIRAWEYAARTGQIVFDDGSAGIARQGDYVRVLIGNPAPVAGMLGGTVFVPSPPGAPIPTPVPMAPFMIATVTGIFPDTVHGSIRGGAPRVTG